MNCLICAELKRLFGKPLLCSWSCPNMGRLPDPLPSIASSEQRKEALISLGVKTSKKVSSGLIGPSQTYLFGGDIWDGHECYIDFIQSSFVFRGRRSGKTMTLTGSHSLRDVMYLKVDPEQVPFICAMGLVPWETEEVQNALRLLYELKKGGPMLGEEESWRKELRESRKTLKMKQFCQIFVQPEPKDAMQKEGGRWHILTPDFNWIALSPQFEIYDLSNFIGHWSSMREKMLAFRNQFLSLKEALKREAEGRETTMSEMMKQFLAREQKEEN